MINSTCRISFIFRYIFGSACVIQFCNLLIVFVAFKYMQMAFRAPLVVPLVFVVLVSHAWLSVLAGPGF